MLNKAILVCFILLVLVVIFMSVSGHGNSQSGQTYAAAWTLNGNSNINGSVNVSKNNNSPDISSDVNSNKGVVKSSDLTLPDNIKLTSSSPYVNVSSDSTNAQVSNWNDTSSGNFNYPAGLDSNSGIPSSLAGQKQTLLGVISQEDPTQYKDASEYNLWHPSTCSAASTASVLNAFGFKVKISDVLAIMETRGGISPVSGLSDYSNFAAVAQKFGLHAILDENRDLTSHFDSLLAQLKANKPVIVNVQDSTFFPAGHFMVAYGINADGTVAVMNSDPEPGKGLLQAWPLDTFKLYFSRTMRTVLFTK